MFDVGCFPFDPLFMITAQNWGLSRSHHEQSHAYPWFRAAHLR